MMVVACELFNFRTLCGFYVSSLIH